MREYMQNYSAERKRRVHEILGGKCVTCGSVEELQVHHKDRSKKRFTIGTRWHREWSQILQELEICELLCESCHQAEHQSQFPHGTAQRYWRGCKCSECKNAKNRHHNEYRKARKGVKH